jgi:plasmid stabilization system protein ParE
MGHRRVDWTDEAVRFWVVLSYLIVYRLDSRPLQVVRILHGARNVPTLI